MENIVTAYAVIGALYGDEAKGATVNALAFQAMEADEGCLVVRSNGGAQAAHTVCLDDGTKHVFHHFGSGTFAGAETYLSRFMIINPIVFHKEWDELVSKGCSPKVSVSPLAQVTFPSDMLINQIIESERGVSRHGSCGLGIGETMDRVEKNRLSVTVSDLIEIARMRRDPDEDVVGPLLNKFDAVLGLRFEELGIDLYNLKSDFAQYIDDYDIFEAFLDDVEFFLENVDVVAEAFIDSDRTVIFEGAQGLALDRLYGHFPYVTRSNTGVINCAELCEEMGIEELEVLYVSRAYGTRHGAGPLSGEEQFEQEAYDIVDETNIPNPWQGTLRFAPLDITYIVELIQRDISRARNTTETKLSISFVLTCIDQVKGKFPYLTKDGVVKKVTLKKLQGMIMSKIKPERLYVSSGPTRSSFTVLPSCSG
jgi:adenylosuccinate synthase